MLAVFKIKQAGLLLNSNLIVVNGFIVDENYLRFVLILLMSQINHNIQNEKCHSNHTDLFICRSAR